MLAAAAILIAVSLPAAEAATPLGVAIATGGSAKKHEAALTEEVLRSLEADPRFVPMPLQEEPGDPATEEAAQAALTAARDAFLILETDEAIARQQEGAQLLLRLLYEAGPAEGALKQRVLDAYAQHVGMLMQVGDKRKAAKVAATLGHLDADYRPAEVEFVTEAAIKLIGKEQKRHKKRKKGKVVVSTGRGGPAALVRVDGEERGLAPVKLKLPPGDHVVTFHAPGAVTQSVLVEVKARKAAKVKRTLVSTPAAQRVAEAMTVLDLTRPGYQRVMGEVGPAFDAPEVLFITLREVGTALQLRATRVDMGEQIIRGASKTTVDRRAKELDMALLFVLEEALLGARAGGAAATVAAAETAPSAGEPAANEPAAPEAAPREEEQPRASSTERDAETETASNDTQAAAEEADEAPTQSEPAEREPESKVAAAEPNEPAPSAAVEQPAADASPEPEVAASVDEVSSPSEPEEAEAEEGSGALVWGVAGAAGGLGAVVIGVGVGAAAVTAVLLTQSATGRPAGGTTASAQRTGTTWTATGMVY